MRNVVSIVLHGLCQPAGLPHHINKRGEEAPPKRQQGLLQRGGRRARRGLIIDAMYSEAMVDYSRFDKIDDSDGEEEPSLPVKPTAVAPTAAAAPPEPSVVKATSKGTDGRLKFEHQGKTIYEWEQSLEEVNIYVKPPPGVKASMIDCTITHLHLALGLKGNPPFIDEDTGGPVKSKDSFWLMEQGEININLQKMNKGEIWEGALKGRGQQMDPFTTEGVKKQMMLERFQEENPGFDFSGAEFNGAVPDPRTFMGGIRST